MTVQKSSVFRLMNPDTLPAWHDKAWEYLCPGDEVDIDLAKGQLGHGVVLDVMPDGSGVWVYVNGLGRKLFGAEEEVEIRAVRMVARPNITDQTGPDEVWRLF